MKNKIAYVIIAAVAVLLALGFVYAVSPNEQGCEHSQAYGILGHASDTAKDPVTGHASENSVLNRCVVSCPPGDVPAVGGTQPCPPDYCLDDSAPVGTCCTLNCLN